MKHNGKAFLAGALVTLLICLAGTAAASGRNRTIEVVFDGIKVALFGEEHVLRDAGGQEVEPFLYNDSVYVPLRAVSELFGYQVDWDEGERRVNIGEQLSLIPMEIDYQPLADVSPEKVLEKKLLDTQVIHGNQVYEKTEALESLLQEQRVSCVLVDESGNTITIGSVETEPGGCTDVKIARYDTEGKVCKEAVYGGSDFDEAYDAKYQPGLGIVLYGYTQSQDGDFGCSSGRQSFFALADSDTLALKWVYLPEGDQQIQDAFAVSEHGIYFNMIKYAKDQSGAPLLPVSSVAKLDRQGALQWQKEESAQRVASMAELADGTLVLTRLDGDEKTLVRLDPSGTRLAEKIVESAGVLTAAPDGGVLSVEIRNIKTVPQPAYISSIWFDTETVVSKYDAELNLEWRKTYDAVKDERGLDLVVPMSDGSLIIQ